MEQRYWQDEESEINFLQEDFLGPIEEEVQQGAEMIRAPQQKISDAAMDPVDWEYINQFLDLETHPNYRPATPQAIGFLDVPELEFEALDLNAIPANIPRLPQQVRRFDLNLEGVNDRKIFNNMPGFLISAIQKLRKRMAFNDLITQKTSLIPLVRECWIKLVDKVLMQLSSKDGNREQLRMVFNDVDEDLNEELAKKVKKTDFIITMKKYFELLNVYRPEIVNEAKKELRNSVGDLLEKSWMHKESQNREFKGNNVQLKKRVFYQYMSSFREEIVEGELSQLINREHVLGIELFHY